MKTETMTVKAAAAIIESHVPDWDGEVLERAAEFAMHGGRPWAFHGRPTDQAEYVAFCKAFDEIQSN